MMDDLFADAPWDVSSGKSADPQSLVQAAVPGRVLDRFELRSYRNAAVVLRHAYPEQFADIMAALDRLTIPADAIRSPGGAKSVIARSFEALFDDSWRETRITADLHVRLIGTRQGEVRRSEVRAGYLDGHRIDLVKGRVALDLEWNSKDQTYDRDLNAFSAFHLAGAVDVGVIVTRGLSMDSSFFRRLGRVLDKDGTEGAGEVWRKYGASTTSMGKLLYRLDAGRNGGCPVLAVGITPKCVTGLPG